MQGLAQCASKEAAVEISRTASHALGEADNAWRKVMDLVDDQRTKQETVTRLAQVLQLRGRAVAIEDPAAALPHFLEATQLLPTEPSASEALAKVYHIVGDEVNSKKAGARLGGARSQQQAAQTAGSSRGARRRREDACGRSRATAGCGGRPTARQRRRRLSAALASTRT